MRRKRRMKAILSWILTIVVLCGMGRVCAAEEAKQTDMEILKFKTGVLIGIVSKTSI